MYQLLYVSTATHPLTDAESVALLKQARKKNAALAVTGMLLYKAGQFMQILEGEEAAVLTLYKRIARDERHHDLIVIFQRPCEKRVFSEWSMGFVNLGYEGAEQIPGYSPFLTTPLDSEHFIRDPTLSMQFLNIFKYAKLGQ